MSNKSIGEIISYLRKERGMTQNDLAEKMHVTDKAVSKWERNISYPDINSIQELANILDITVDELLNAKPKKSNKEITEIIDLGLLGVALAMSICIIVLSILNKIDLKNATIMLGIGLSCLAIHSLKTKNDK